MSVPSTTFVAPSPPTKPLPPGSCDTHAHVFGPYNRFPLAETRQYTPAAAPKSDYLAMLDAVGFERGILVHGGAHGWDQRAMLDTIAAAPDRLRGIGVMPADATAEALSALAGAGVSGLRFTEVAGPTANQRIDGRVGFDTLHALAPKMREVGWHAVLWANASTLAKQAHALSRLEMPLVIDHLGYFDVSLGVTDPAFQTLLALVKDGTAWVKLTVFRNSKAIPMHEDVRPFHDALVDANPDRLLWGSDWPFLGMTTYRPDNGALLDLMDQWLPDPALREKILVTNPAALYGFRDPV
jgi:2-pyrone-4,6-dicarboxylate lactonase